MAEYEFKPNRDALKELMQSGGIQSLVREKASSICSTAQSIGKGKYYMKSDIGKVSARAVVVTGDRLSKRDNAKHNILLKSL